MKLNVCPLKTLRFKNLTHSRVMFWRNISIYGIDDIFDYGFDPTIELDYFRRFLLRESKENLNELKPYRNRISFTIV